MIMVTNNALNNHIPFVGAQPLSILKIIEGLQSSPQTYSTPLYSFSLCMEITNRVFNDSLLNTTSQQYKRMYNEVSGVVSVSCHLSLNRCPYFTHNRNNILSRYIAVDPIREICKHDFVWLSQLDLAFNCSNCDTRETYRGVTNIRFR